ESMNAAVNRSSGSATLSGVRLTPTLDTAMPNILIVGGVSLDCGPSSWRHGEKQRTGAIGVNAMIKELWNVGLKVTDLDREVAFLREVGASLVLRERASMVGEEREYAILMLGGVRMLLFET